VPLLRLDPTEWDRWDRWRDDMLRMWNRFTPDGWTIGNQPSYWLSDGSDTVVLEVELPGVDPKGVDLDVDDQSVTVRGQWRAPEVGSEGGRRQGEFGLAVTLPTAVNPANATAEFHHGLLRVEMPKAMGPRRRLDIRVTGDSQSRSQRPM
jgi:HSP20 family protein